MTYTTQMDAARKGIVTEQMKRVAEKEHLPVEQLRELVAEGKVAICANKRHTCLDPEGVGSMLRTKVNVNLGVSRDCKDYDVEMQKVMEAVNMGAHAIMDLSSHGNTIPFRRKLTSECPAMIGTVPVYDSVIHYQRDLDTLTAKDFIDVVRLHAQDGVRMRALHLRMDRVVRDVDDLHVAVLGDRQQVRVQRVPRRGGARAGQRVEEQLLQLALVRHLVARVARAIHDHHLMGKRSLLQVAGMPNRAILHHPFSVRT